MILPFMPDLVAPQYIKRQSNCQLCITRNRAWFQLNMSHPKYVLYYN